MDRQVILDTETTGLSPAKGHRIIEIGCLEMVKRQLTGESFHVYINPQRSVDEGAFNVHGIGDDFLLDKPVFADIAQDFISFITGSELVIHNASFDVGFMDHEFGLLPNPLGKTKDFSEVLDTLKLARSIHPGQANSLDALCKRYDVDKSKRELHGALLDSELLAQVYLKMTGGQVQLFEKDDQGDSEQGSVTDGIGDIEHVLKVIKATEAELATHKQWRERQEKAGVCDWPCDSD